MLISDPKGELYQLHAKKLKKAVYKVQILDLRNPYNSVRWNPLERAYLNYQRMLHLEKEVKVHEDKGCYEFAGKLYYDPKKRDAALQVKKQQLNDVVYEDLNDIVSVLCPVTNKNEPMWESGAKNFILAIALAMLEDSENPENGLTKEKYNFYSIMKVATNTEVGVRKIIDDYHFIASNGESWHTGMFYEQGCSHGRDMIPLEFNPRMFDKAEERLKNHQIYHTEVYTMKDGHIEHKGTLIARYDSRHNDFRADLGEEISRSFLSLEASLALICPDYAEELRCIVQEWGVTGEDKQGILLDDGNTHIVYDGAEYIPVACGKTSVDLRSVAVLKKMCSPAQQFVFVQDFVKRENGEYCGDIIEKTVDFLDAAELFEGLTGRRIEEATPTNCAIQSKGEAEM